MVKKSAGILLYRTENNVLQVFLVHPGGPFYLKKDLGVWTIPKGEFNEEEDPLACAKREFAEETGVEITGDCIALTPIKQKGGKMVYAWAVKGNLDPAMLHSNTFSLEWPPRSGKFKEFPEVDRGGWFGIASAREKILPSQVGLVDELEQRM